MTIIVEKIRKKQCSIIVCLFLVVSIIGVYGQVRHFDFVNFDDEPYVTQNRHVQKGITPDGIIWAFTTFYEANWHPLTWLSHMADDELYGLNPMGHHWTSLLFHIANTLLLFLILKKMTKDRWPSAFVAALFALHPLHVESVAWVAERKDVLSAFFGFLTIGAYYRYVKQPVPGRFFPVFLFLSLGLMAKPMLVTYPFVLLLLDFWPLGRFQINFSRPFITMLQSGGKLFKEKLWLFIPVIISCVLTFLAQSSKGAVGTLKIFSIKVRIANALVSYVHYIGKTFLPWKLSVFYPYPVSIPAWQTTGAAALIAGSCYLALRYIKKCPYIAFGLFWYLGTLVPVIGLVQVGSQAMADRYTYVPLIGIFVIVVWGARDLLKKTGLSGKSLSVFSIILLSAFAVRTYFQLGHWKNGIALFENAVRVTENNYWAYNNLGTAYGKTDNKLAILNYKKALKIQPGYAMALFNLGTALMNEKNYDEAVLYLKKAIKINPEDTDSMNNLANILFIQGKKEKAFLMYQNILKIDHKDADAHSNLANMLIATNRLNEAAVYCNEALMIEPDHRDAHYNMGRLLLRLGKNKKAMAHFAQAIRIDPDYAEAYNYIGVILAKSGNRDKAGMFFLKSIELKPDYPAAKRNLEILKKAGSKTGLQ